MPFEADPYLDGDLDAAGIMPPTMLATDYIPLLKGHLHSDGD